MVLAPAVLKTTLHEPLPPERVMVQLVSAPVMATVPVGTNPAPLTVTSTVTDCPAMDGSWVSAVITVVLAEPGTVPTVWLAVPELLVWDASPL